MRSIAHRSGTGKLKSSQQVGEDHWRRRQALQVAAQLPDNPEEALAVLRHAETLVRSFLAPGKPA
jgi:hypothetical protein